jgi:hypothetical protein
MLAAGACLGLIAAAAWLLGRHVAEARWYDRPRFARVPGFDGALAVLRWLAFGAGLLLMWRASARAAAAASSLFLAAWAWRAMVRSHAWKRRLMRKDYDRLRRDRPGLEETDLLVQVVLLHHPAWGEELIAQMVLDYGTLDDLARVVARMERGFRGFRTAGGRSDPGRRS